MDYPFVVFLEVQNCRSRYILPTGDDDSDIEVNEIPRQSGLNTIAEEENEGEKRTLDGTRGACQHGGRNSQRFEEVHQCNCGHKGPIASHLRVNQQCVHGIRYELSLGEEISDESLIIQTTLVLQGCPAISCVGGNHDEIPMVCMSWWQESGWNVMKWEDIGEDLTSTVIKQKCKQFVVDLMRQNDDGRHETAPDNNENAADRIQTEDNPEDTTRNGRREGGKRPVANVSLPWNCFDMIMK